MMTLIRSKIPRYQGVRISNLALALAAVFFSGCSADEFLMSNRWTWLWAVAPLVGIAFLGGAFVLSKRKKQLKNWDLATSPEEPGVMSIMVWLAVAAFVLAIAFAIYNLFLDFIDPAQLALNIGAWVIGSIIGTAVAFLVGLKLAEP